MQTIKKELKAVLKNWKTTLTGVIMLVGLLMYWLGDINTTDFCSLIAAVGAAGLLISKDSTHN